MLRILRLIRIFRVMSIPRLQCCVDMITSVIEDALPALFLLFFMSLLACVLFASCIWFAEGTAYRIDENWPDGAYIRPTYDGYDVEKSPFRSIFSSFWWFFTTATTVGYGDEYPTTTWGRIIGVCAFYTGIVLLALPIGIVGGAFTKHYPTFCAAIEEMKGVSTPSGNSDAVLWKSGSGSFIPCANVQCQDADVPHKPKEAWR